MGEAPTEPGPDRDRVSAPIDLTGGAADAGRPAASDYSSQVLTGCGEGQNGDAARRGQGPDQQLGPIVRRAALLTGGSAVLFLCRRAGTRPCGIVRTDEFRRILTVTTDTGA